MKKIFSLLILTITLFFTSGSTFAQTIPPTMVNYGLQQADEHQLFLNFGFANDNTFPISMHMTVGTTSGGVDVLDSLKTIVDPTMQMFPIEVGALTDTTMFYLKLLFWNNNGTLNYEDSILFIPLVSGIPTLQSVKPTAVASKDAIVISNTSAYIGKPVTLYDILGRTMFVGTINGETEIIPIPIQLPKGQNFVVIGDGGDKLIMRIYISP